MTIDKSVYRDAMSKLGAAVSVVTSNGPAGISGATVSAVCSVTDTPPTLLVCVNQSARSNSIIRENRVLCINVLASANSDVADLFAGQTGVAPEERFAHVGYSTLETTAPALDAAIVAFDCRLEQTIESGTHSIFLARVVDVRTTGAEGCLMYFSRSYVSLGGALASQ